MVQQGTQRRHIRLSYIATGESVVAELLDDEAPLTCRQIWDLLPVENPLIHGQFSGTEVFMLLDNPQPATPENQVQIPLPGELLYFYDPGGSATSGRNPMAEICVIYGRGVILRGPEGVPTHAGLFARIPGDWKYDWRDFAQACRRVRWEGPQRLRIERVE
jgi:hypothetical protein